ncbi:uncharacterized protein LAESUDRAFT_432955 [Laetiporus sulphureus 93-53]|uniref:Uncharacterized protein n=1 Tax=Laetiporus sulphureus 93-53 TaxID=1314785 RepID=A0A165C5N0_9APHY|nr:uncharacterized protein LAESUDRAFT_432955 [Laetiporus sulphureus 93-53]KZT02248.1 hypothetical protein LAESUDRAFT_432955 [Laetiporus sulphureus 93-53]
MRYARQGYRRAAHYTCWNKKHTVLWGFACLAGSRYVYPLSGGGAARRQDSCLATILFRRTGPPRQLHLGRASIFQTVKGRPALILSQPRYCKCNSGENVRRIFSPMYPGQSADVIRDSIRTTPHMKLHHRWDLDNENDRRKCHAAHEADTRRDRGNGGLDVVQQSIRHCRIGRRPEDQRRAMIGCSGNWSTRKSFPELGECRPQLPRLRRVVAYLRSL